MFLIGGGIFIYFTLLFHKVEADCSLTIPSLNRPLITQKFGLKDIIIQNTDVIDLDNNDMITVYCATGFRSIMMQRSNRYGSYVNEQISPTETMLQIACKSDSPTITKPYIENDYEISTLTENKIPECTDSSYALFESKNSLPNCYHESSFILGARLNPPIIIAALCYDLDKLKIKYASHKLHQSTFILSRRRNFYPPGSSDKSFSQILKLKEYLFKFPSDFALQQDLVKQLPHNFWLHIANYEYDNIMQSTETLDSSLLVYRNFLKIIWWKNLRTGNWRRFMQLLEQRTKHIDYNIYTGISGSLHVPVENIKCDNATSMELELSESAVIPQFIWTYVQSTSLKPAEQFVVIAYNSPYFEYFDRSSTVICNDMCDEIDWMQPMQNTRMIAALGGLYCCHPDEVVGLLDGLPWNRSNQTIEIATDANKGI